MKLLDRIILFIFSILFLTITIIGGMFLWTDPQVSVAKFIANNHTPATMIFIGVYAILVIFAIKGAFFQSSNYKKTRGIILENENGKLLISMESLENLVKQTLTQIPGVKDLNAKIELDSKNKINVYLNIVVNSTVIIKDVTKEIQEQIKTVIKNSTDLSVSKVNINIHKIKTQDKKVKTTVAPKEVEKQEPKSEPKAEVKPEVKKEVTDKQTEQK